MGEIAYVNGQFVDPDQAVVSINDRGYTFGDGVYEVIRGYQGRLWAVERHFARLRHSLREVAIELDCDQLRATMLEAVDRAGFEAPLVYLQVTRGIQPRSHTWDGAQLEPSVVITVRPVSELPAERRRAGVGCITTADVRWHRCDIKSLNLLANVMAKELAHSRGAHEAILIRPDGTVTEATSASVAIVTDGVIRSHPDGPAVLPSITRQIAWELAEAAGLVVVEEPFGEAALRSADEVFLLGTTAEVLGVVSLDGQPVASGGVGPMTNQLAAAYQAAIDAGQD